MSLGSLFQQNTDTDPVKSQSEPWHLEEHGSEGFAPATSHLYPSLLNLMPGDGQHNVREGLFCLFGV